MSTEITIQQDQIDINVTQEVIVIESPTGGYPLPSSVYSVFGRVGNVVAEDGDYDLTQLGDVTITNPLTGQALVYNGTAWVNNTETYTGTVTSVDMSVPTGLTISGNPITTAGTLALGLASGYSIPTDANQSLWTTAYNDKINSAAVTGLATKTLTLTQQDGGTIIASWDDAEATRLITEVYNETGATLTKGTVVYINGGHGNLPTVTKAIATSDATSAQTYGVVQSDITNNNNGYVVVFGSLTNIDTQAYTNGTQLYLSGTTAGAWTSTKPFAPIHLVYVGIVTRSHPTQGVVEIRIQNGYELEELHDVSAQNPNNGDILQYVSSTDLWTSVAGTTTNISEGTNLYYTDARSRAAFSETVTGLDYNSTTGVLSTTTGYGIPTTASQITWDTAYSRSLTSASVSGTTTKTLTLNEQGGGTITATWSDYDTAPVTSVFGRTGAITAQSGDYTTTLVTEGTNMYYTQARFDTAFSNKTTTDLTEGTNLYYTQTRFNSAFAAKSTTDLAEGTNLYFTTARAQAAISGTAPISVASGVVSISQAGTSTDGYLSSTDWNTFNNKQAAGNYITALTGEATASGPGSASVTLTNSAVIGKVLTGLNVTGGTVVATDSILDAFGKVQNQINGLIGGSIYQGVWNASTNTPTLTSSVGTKGYYYIVNVAGTTNLDGITDWNVGDWAIFDGTAWQQVDNTDAVVSVNGFTGAVSLTTSNISEGTNLYYTDARARGALSAGTGISYNSTTGVITNSAPDQTVALTGGTGISTSGTYPNFTITNTAPDQVVALTGAGTTSISGTYPNFTITSNDQYTGTVTSVAASVPTGLVVTGSPITTTGTLAISYDAGYSIPTNTSQSNWDTAYTNRITSASAPLSISSNAISITQATTSTNGYLTSSDWNTFNGKQGAITLTTTGSSGAATLVGNTLNIPNYGSALSGYLPLTGGTLTGALIGTTGNFTRMVVGGSATSRILQVNTSGNDGIRIQTSGDNPTLDLMQTAAANAGARNWRLVTNWEGWGTLDFQSGTTNTQDPGTTRLSISGTTGVATFSSSVVTYSSATNTAGLLVIGGSSIGTANVNNGQIYLGATSAYRGVISYDEGPGYLYIDNTYNNNSGNIYFRTKTGGTAINALTIAGTGAATFSSTITSLAASGQATIIAEGSATNGEGAIQVKGKNSSGTSRTAQIKYDNSDVIRIGTSSAIGMQFETSDVARLTIASTGAATFSSSVTASGVIESALSLINSTNGINLRNSAGSGYGNSINFYQSSTLSNQILAESSVANTSEMSFKTLIGGTLGTRLFISSSGNVGIGTTPNYKFEVSGISASTTGFLLSNGQYTSITGVPYIGMFATEAGSSDGFGALLISSRTDAARPIIFGTSNGSVSTERMRITSGGTVLINRTTVASITGDGSLQVNKEIVSTGTSAFVGMQNRASSNFFGFYGSTNLYVYNSDSGIIGTFSYNSGTYTPSSDINRKKDFEQSTIGLNEILGLKPTLYRMKTDDETSDKHLGFIAQEVKEFIPQAYVETGDDENVFIGLSEMPIIAALVKAIQELNAKVSALENKS